MMRALFGGQKASQITPEQLKAVEDQLDSKVRLLEETSRCYEKSKIDLRDLKNALRTAESKNEKLELEVATLKKELAAKAPAAASSNNDETMAALQKELDALRLENERLKRELEDDKQTRDELTAVLVRPSAPVE
jgi:chromosome segregation ATPase